MSLIVITVVLVSLMVIAVVLVSLIVIAVVDKSFLTKVVRHGIGNDWLSIDSDSPLLPTSVS